MENRINESTWTFPIRKSFALKSIRAGREGIRVALEMVSEMGRRDTIGELMELDDKLDSLRAMMDCTEGRVVYLNGDDMDLVTKRCTAFARLCV